MTSEVCVVTAEGNATKVAVTSMRHLLGQETGPGEDDDGVMVRSIVVGTAVTIVVGTVVTIVVGTVVTNVVGTRTVVGCREVNVTVEKMVDTVVTAGL